MKLKDLKTLVEKNDRGKEDIEVKSSGLAVNEAGELVWEGKSFRPNDWAWYLLFNKASKGATKRYLFRHPTDQWIRMVNYDLQHSKQNWILCTREDEMIGFVSNKYC